MSSPVFCVQCGSENSLGHQTCLRCGEPLIQSPPVVWKKPETTIAIPSRANTVKFSTCILFILGLILPAWPITLPICWIVAYLTYRSELSF